MAGRDVTDLPTEVTFGDEAIKDLVVTLTSKPATVSGALLDLAAKPAPDYTVLLFPVDTRYWYESSRRIVTARPSSDGEFEIAPGQGLPAGTYYLAALTDLSPREQYDTLLLADVAKSAIKITIAAGEQKRQDLRIRR